MLNEVKKLHWERFHYLISWTTTITDGVTSSSGGELWQVEEQLLHLPTRYGISKKLSDAATLAAHQTRALLLLLFHVESRWHRGHMVGGGGGDAAGCCRASTGLKKPSRSNQIVASRWNKRRRRQPGKSRSLWFHHSCCYCCCCFSLIVVRFVRRTRRGQQQQSFTRFQAWRNGFRERNTGFCCWIRIRSYFCFFFFFFFRSQRLLCSSAFVLHCRNGTKRHTSAWDQKPSMFAGKGVCIMDGKITVAA